METMTALPAHKESQSPKTSSATPSATTPSKRPPLLAQRRGYHSVTSIPNLLNYDGQANSGIRTAGASQSNLTVSTTGDSLFSSSKSSPQYHYGGRYRSGSLDFLAETAIDQDINQEEFKRILKRMLEYSLKLSDNVLKWSSCKIKDVQSDDISQLSSDSRSLLKYTNRLLELKNMSDWIRKKPQLPGIDQLRNELRKPMTDYQFPMRPRSKKLFNVTVRTPEVEIPSAASTSSTEKPAIPVTSHKGSKSDSFVTGANQTFKVDKAKSKKRNSVSQHQRKISIAAGDGTESCKHCNETVTPEWRRGPYGNRTLCNACGLFYCKLVRKFDKKDANVLMHYRKAKSPEDRRVPESMDVPRSFIETLENDEDIDDNFNMRPKAPSQ